MRKIEINGVTFELTIPRRTVHPTHGYICVESCIFNWYDRPSQYKVEIWKDWVRWARETKGIEVFEIGGANCFQFSIIGLYVAEDGKVYNIYITSDHNRAILVNS